MAKKTKQQQQDYSDSKELVVLSEVKNIVRSLTDDIGRDLSVKETNALVHFLNSGDLDKAAEHANIDRSEIVAMSNEDWWKQASNKYLYSFQEEFVHGLMSRGNKLIDLYDKGLSGELDPRIMKAVNESIKTFAQLGRDYMRPLMTTKHEIDIKQETTHKELKVTADLNKMTNEEIMELTLFGKMPDRNLSED